MKTKRIDADSTLKKVAEEHHTSVEEVRREIEYALSEARSNPDPQVQAWWKQSPWGENLPTPEEFIAYVAEGLIK